jgi:hypothetical protein
MHHLYAKLSLYDNRSFSVYMNVQYIRHRMKSYLGESKQNIWRNAGQILNGWNPRIAGIKKRIKG